MVQSFPVRQHGASVGNAAVPRVRSVRKTFWVKVFGDERAKRRKDGLGQTDGRTVQA